MGVSNKQLMGARLSDGTWNQSGTPGTTTITFKNGSNVINPGATITLSFPESTPINSSGSNIIIAGQVSPTRANNTVGNQIALTLSNTINTSQEVSLVMSDALLIFTGNDTGSSVSVNIYSDTGTLLDYLLATTDNAYTTVSAEVPQDNDSDGIPTWWELLYGFDPTDSSDGALDTDDDGLTNIREYLYGTNPLLWDTDGGTVRDGKEIQLNRNPLDPSDDLDPILIRASPEPPEDKRGDSDGDGISNVDEDKYGTDKNSIDTDKDGLNDYAEIFDYGTNPSLADTDGDELTDYQELIVYLTDPFNRDTDFDGLTDYEEIIIYGTNPRSADTDGGGMSDLDEIRNGYDPLKEGDEFEFTFDVYFGKETNNLFKSLDNYKLTVYEGMDLTFEAIRPTEADSITILFNGKGFTSEKEYIKSKIIIPTEPGVYPIQLKVNLKTGKEVAITRFLEVRQKGKILKRIEGTFNQLYNQVEVLEDEIVNDAKIEVFLFNEITNSLELYQSDLFNTQNPQYSSQEGKYAIALEPGNYLIRVSKPGIGTKEILFETNQNTVFTQDIMITYTYDNAVWGGVFTATFLLIWNVVRMVQIINAWIQYYIRSRTTHIH